MKKIIYSALLLVIFAFQLKAQEADLSQKPEPLPKKEFTFPEYTVETLSNGIKVFVIEDHEQPTVALRLLIPGGNSADTKPGVSDFMASLLTKGAAGMSALDIAQKLDGIGASVSASAGADFSSVYASTLTKHLPLVLDLYSKIILQPEFYSEEFEKLVPQFIANVKDEKSRPSSLAAALTRKVIYGENHPYAQKTTEESIKNIKLNDLKDYYKTYFVPNNATIAVIGDVSPKDIVAKLESAFASWKPVERAPKTVVSDAKPMPRGVYFIERPGSVQSTISVSTVAVPYMDDQYETLKLASQIMGAGFAGRLFRTLRETYSYTYTPYGYLTSSKFANRFVAGADVRNNVTDSAITVILDQLKLLSTETPKDEELDLIKNYTVGHYLMSFENTNFVASLIQDADFQEKPMRVVKAYPEKVMRTSAHEIMRVANTYMNPNQAYIVVVGDPSVKEKIEKFGPVFVYNTDIQPAAEEKLKKVSMTPQELLNKYAKAIGGADNLAKINTIVTTGNASLNVQGQSLSGNFKIIEQQPNKQYSMMDMTMFKQEEWINGIKAWNKQSGLVEYEGDELKEKLIEAQLFKYTKLDKLGYSLNILGQGDKYIIMEAVSPSGKQNKFFFNKDNYLIEKVEQVETLPQGPISIITYFKDYRKVQDYKVPFVTTVESPMFTLTMNSENVELNTPVEPSVFEPAAK